MSLIAELERVGELADAASVGTREFAMPRVDAEFYAAALALLRSHGPALRVAVVEREALRAALKDARDCVESWASYASPYFQDKHDLAGDLARIDAALGQGAEGFDPPAPG